MVIKEICKLLHMVHTERKRKRAAISELLKAIKKVEAVGEKIKVCK